MPGYWESKRQAIAEKIREAKQDKEYLLEGCIVEHKLFDSELKVMEVLWNEGETSAKRIAEVLRDLVGWSKTTTYTVIKKCVDKGAIERLEPGFVCRAKISREDAQQYETNELIERMYGGSADRLVASLLSAGRLKPEEIDRLRRMVDELE